VTVKEILNNEWPKDTDECVQRLVNENVDGALLMTYTAQKLARDDMQNRLRVEVVPGASMSLRMGVLSEVDRSFYGLWEKTLYNVSRKSRAEIVQSYVEDVETPTIMAYLFDHPLYLVALIVKFTGFRICPRPRTACGPLQRYLLSSQKSEHHCPHAHCFEFFSSPRCPPSPASAYP